MITLPVFTALKVERYGLFPGNPPGAGITWSFNEGITLIADVNGLGKTTLITMLLRALTGPYDLTADGLPERLESIVPETAKILKARNLDFFAQRVSDRAERAEVTLTALFGKTEVIIRRRLSDLRLLSFAKDGDELDLGANRDEREKGFQKQICDLFDLSSFVDVLLVLHHIIFFKESRPGALWDENAQRHVLRAVFLDKDSAARIAAGERQLQSADSRARNISASAYQIDQKLNSALAAREGTSEKALELATEQTLLNADLREGERLDQILVDLDQTRKQARLEYEKAKLSTEEAEAAVESLKFAVLARLYPNIEEATKLIILKAIGSGECLVCGSDTSARLLQVQDQLSRGICPVCAAEPEEQENVIPAFRVEESRVKKARTRANIAVRESESSLALLNARRDEYEVALTQLIAFRARIDERTVTTRRLSSELPLDEEEFAHLRTSLELTRRSQRDAESARSAAARTVRELLEAGRQTIEADPPSSLQALNGM